MKDNIFEIVKQNHENSGGHSGISLSRISRMVDLTAKETRDFLVELFYENKVIAREGKGGKLFFLK